MARISDFLGALERFSTGASHGLQTALQGYQEPVGGDPYGPPPIAPSRPPQGVYERMRQESPAYGYGAAVGEAVPWGLGVGVPVALAAGSGGMAPASLAAAEGLLAMLGPTGERWLTEQGYNPLQALGGGLASEAGLGLVMGGPQGAARRVAAKVGKEGSESATATGTQLRSLLETREEKLGDVPQVTQSSIYTPKPQGGNSKYIEQRRLADRKVRSPQRQQFVREAIERQMTPGKAWYNTMPLREFWMNYLGETEGDLLWRLFIAHNAPSSIGSPVPKQIQRALFTTAVERSGVQPGPWQTVAGRGANKRVIGENVADPRQNIFGPVGAVAFRGGMSPGYNRINELYRAGRDDFSQAFNPMGQQKTYRFNENLLGNYQNVPGDMHLTRDFFGPIGAGLNRVGDKTAWEQTKRRSGGVGKAPSQAEHDAMEQAHREIFAPEFGITPAQSMAAQWVDRVEREGVSDPRGMMTLLEGELDKLATKWGTDKKSVLERIADGDFTPEELGYLGGGSGAILGILFGGLRSMDGNPYDKDPAADAATTGDVS